MKKNISIVLVFISLILIVRNELSCQTYYPIPDSNAKWKVYWMPYPPDIPWSAQHYNYLLSGDTLIEDVSYSKLLKVDFNLYCSQSSDTSYIGGIRNETDQKKVLLYYADKEYVLYDFSLEVGDTIPSSYFLSQEGEMIVCKIDSIELPNSELRRQFTYEFLHSEETCIYNVVEGIGFLGGLLEPMSTSAELTNSLLLCSYLDDSVIYNNILWEDWGYNECEINEDTCLISSINNNYVNDQIIQIVPNPIKENAVIRYLSASNAQSLFTIRLYNMMGQEVKTIHNPSDYSNLIIPGELNNGVYVFLLFQNEKLLQQGKIIISH